MSSSQEVRRHKDKLRGRCALALDWNAKITLALANIIRCSPMTGMEPATISSIEACREYAHKMLSWLDEAEQSARAISAAEAADDGELLTSDGPTDGAPA